MMTGPQIDLGDNFYYEKGYGIYVLDLTQQVARLVLSEEQLGALDKWMKLVRKENSDD